MTNYTKTTDFAAKDALPSGNSAKIVKGSEIDTEFNNIATASATKANANSAALTGTTTFETISDGTIAITAFVDEDNMASDSATLLPTQQSVKAYVDSQVTAQDLDVTDGSTSIDIDLDSESLGILGGTGIDSTASGTGVTLAIDSTVATLTGSQTLSNKTLSAPVVSGNLTTDGLLDGRDVAADGTKLDGIEASADVTDTANVTAAGALMDSEVTNLAQVKAFDSADYATAAQGTTADSALQNVVEDTTPQLGGDLASNGNDILFADNDKAIFGAGSDLQIYHDGSNSYIDEVGTGTLRIRGHNQVRLTDTSNNIAAIFKGDAESTLYHNNSAKLATTSTGIDVTGTATMDGLTVDGAVAINTNNVVHTSLTPSYSFIESDVTGENTQFLQASGTLRIRTVDDSLANPVERLRIDHGTGDISFYNSSGTSQSLFWDSSAESLGIGTTAPERTLHVDSSGVQIGALISSTSTIAARLSLMDANTTSSSKVGIGATGDNLGLYAGGSVRATLESSGNFLVGTTDNSPVGNNVAGVGLFPNGSAQFSRDGGTPLLLNRKTSDGTIVDFRKDGTAVGSIGVNSDRIYLSGASEGVYIDTSLSAFSPCTTSGGNFDDHVDLGGSSSRFKDLYLSGGVYLGGTAAANKLDDYEEGTFTVTLRDATSGGNAASPTVVGTYTKVGRLVTCSFNTALNNIDTTGMTGTNTLFMDLPFTTISTSEEVGTTVYDNLDTGSINASITNVVPETINGTGAVCQFRAYGNNTNDVILKVADITSGTTDFARFTLTYQTS